MRNITSAKQTLQAYVDENKSRRKVIRGINVNPFSGFNKERAVAFTDLIGTITRIETDATISVLEKLRQIQTALQVADTNNRHKESAKSAHDGESTAALSDALDEINRAIRAEVQRLEQERVISVRQQRAAEASRQQAEQAAQAARQRQHLAERIAQERGHDPLDVINEHLSGGDLAQYLEEQFALASDETAKTNAERIIEKIVEFSQVSNLHTHREFIQALKSEIINRRLLVNDAVITLIASSPLAQRYDALRSRFSVDNGRSVREMLQKIADILAISLQNQNGALQDIYQLIMLENENALHDLLQKLRTEKVLQISDNRSVSGNADRVGAELHRAFEAIGAVKTDNPQHLDPLHVEHALQETLGELEVDEGETPELGQEAFEAMNNQFYFCVGLANKIEAVSEAINRHVQSRIATAQNYTQDDKSRVLEALAADLQPQYKLLVALNDRMVASQDQLNAHVLRLEEMYRAIQLSQTHDTNQQLAAQYAELTSAIETWKTQFQDANQLLNTAMQQLNRVSEVSPLDGFNAAGALHGAARNVAQEEQLKIKMHQQIVALERMLVSKIQIARTVNPAFPQASSASGQVQHDALTVGFLSKVANHFQHDPNNRTLAARLISKLLAADLLTTEVQHKLLRHNNMRVLLDLQQALSAMHIAVNENQLVRLWNGIQDQVIDFNLIVSMRAKLNLGNDSVLNIISHLASQWESALPALSAIFDNDRHTAALDLVVEASKNDVEMIDKIKKLFDAISEYAPDMLDDFFDQSAMQTLIVAIQRQEYRLTDELVCALSMRHHPAFQSITTWSELIKQTEEYVQRGLSYQNLQTVTDRAFSSSMLLGLTPKAVYSHTGVEQVNMQLPYSTAGVFDPRRVYWGFVSALGLTQTNKPTALSAQASQEHLTPEQRFLLPLLEAVVRNQRVAVDQDKPNLFVTLDNVQNPAAQQFMEGALYTRVVRLKEYADRLTVLHSQLAGADGAEKTRIQAEIAGVEVEAKAFANQHMDRSFGSSSAGTTAREALRTAGMFAANQSGATATAAANESVAAAEPKAEDSDDLRAGAGLGS